MRRLPLGLALALGFAAPANAISIIAGTDTGGAQGHTGNTGSLTVAVTTSVASPPGSLNVIMCSGGNITWSSASDSAGNTYTGVTATSFLSPRAVREFYTIAANNLPIGGTITCTGNSSSGTKTAVAVSFSGVSATPLDAASLSQSGSAVLTYTVGPTGTLAYPGGSNGEVLVGVVEPGTTAAPTQDATFIDLGTFSTASGAQAAGAFAYKIVSASTAITYAPTGTSSDYRGTLGAFIGTGGGASGSGQGMPLVGVSN